MYIAIAMNYYNYLEMYVATAKCTHTLYPCNVGIWHGCLLITRVHIVYIPHTQVESECMFVSVDSVVLCNWLTAS